MVENKRQMGLVSSRYPTETMESSPQSRGNIRRASRSKSIAEADVGSLLCVDRLGSISDNPAAMSMNESRHSSAARQRSTSNSSATFSDVALLQIQSSWSRAVFFSDAGIAASQDRSVERSPSPLSASALWWATKPSSSAVCRKSAMKTPQGASPARLVSTAGEGPVLCFQRVPFQSLFRS